MTKKQREEEGNVRQIKAGRNGRSAGNMAEVYDEMQNS